MKENTEEYTIFTTTDREGNEIEMAVVDEFEYKNKNYIAAALVVGDEIRDDGFFIFRIKADQDDFAVEKIANKLDYEEIAKAYMEME